MSYHDTFGELLGPRIYGSFEEYRRIIGDLTGLGAKVGAGLIAGGEIVRFSDVSDSDLYSESDDEVEYFGQLVDEKAGGRPHLSTVPDLSGKSTARKSIVVNKLAETSENTKENIIDLEARDAEITLDSALNIEPASEIDKVDEIGEVDDEVGEVDDEVGEAGIIDTFLIDNKEIDPTHNLDEKDINKPSEIIEYDEDFDNYLI